MGRDRWHFGDGLIGLELDAREMLGYLDHEVERQMRFTQTLSLTWLAKDARDDLRARLPLHFIIRNKWTARQIQFRGASMKQHVPFSEVGSTQEYMEWHAMGAWKEAEGEQRVTVPVRVRRPKTIRTTKSRWAGAIARRGNNIIMDLKGGASGLFRMKGRGGKDGHVFQYLFVDKARIQPVWPFRQLVERRVAHSFERITWKALEKAMATAKKRAKRRG